MKITCDKCSKKNDREAIFCRSCGAYLEWSNSPSDGTGAPSDDRTQREANGGASPGGPTAATVHAPAREPAREYERRPQAEDEEEEQPPTVGQLVCSKCGSGNWPDVRFCRRCGTVLESSTVAAPPARLPWLAGAVVWVLKKAQGVEKDPLPAGQRKRPRNPFLGRDRMVLLRTGLKVLAVLLIVGAALIGGLWAWHSAINPQIVSFYGSSREALFPRYRSVPPAAIFYSSPVCVAGVKRRPGAQGKEVTPSKRAVPNQVIPIRPRKNPAPKRCQIKTMHSIAEAFDNSLSSYWLSPTKRDRNDVIVLRFSPEANIAAFTIHAGDPTGQQVVPRKIQMTFYEPAEIVNYPPLVISSAAEKSGTIGSRVRPGRYWPVKAVQEWTLLDTQAQQRFSTEKDLTNIARVVITIRGSYPKAKRKATQALTEVEFFDKY